MNRNVLKYIAILAMTLDHIASFTSFLSPSLYLIFKTIGRITFPIMCFFISEGFQHTSNKKKYALRLFLLALISQIPWTLIQHKTIFTINFFTSLNTIFTLFLSFLFLCIINMDSKKLIKIPLLLLIIIASFACDYKIIGFIYVSYFYIIDNKYKISFLPLLYFTTTTISLLLRNFNNTLISIITNLGLLFTIPLLLLYNNKPGKKNFINKYSFYLYYPLHIFIIFFIKVLL